MGCTVGMSKIPYVDAYPEAEVHAIDLSAPSLRFAHARAESLGKAVHFRQANAEHAPYGDGSFDLVVSHILLHELSCGALDRVLAERSEEHTSELQSLMRISYAVFCLKTKQNRSEPHHQ